MIGETIINFFQNFGMLGFIVALYFIFLVDSMIFPSLPEMFFLIAFLFQPDIKWGILLLFIALLGIFCGNSLLYILAKKARIPNFIKEIMKKYSSMLLLGDERILFLNNIAPVLPYSGAFMAVNEWDYKKSIFYLESGAALKFSVLLLLSNSFYIFFSKGMAKKATIFLIFITLAISFTLSYFRKRKIEGKGSKIQLHGKREL